MPILGSAMTKISRLQNGCKLAVLWLCAVLAALVLIAGAVEARVVDRLAGYVAACEGALLTGNVAAFADLDIETEQVSETLSIFGWRGAAEPGLTVSVLVRSNEGRRTGVCDVSYLPTQPDAEVMAGVAALPGDLAAAAMEDPGHRLELTPSGQVILTCAGARGLALFMDPDAQARGFAAQVATVPPHRMSCEG